MNHSYKIEYPSAGWDYGSFSINVSNRRIGGFYLSVVSTYTCYEKLEFETARLYYGVILASTAQNYADKEYDQKVTNLIESILHYCIERVFPFDDIFTPFPLLSNFFPPTEIGSEYEKLIWGEEISRHRITANWHFLRKELNANDETLFTDDDLFYERIQINLSWLNEQGVIENATGYWTLVSIKWLRQNPVPPGFHYRGSLLVAHFFYKPTIDKVVANIVIKLQRLAPAERHKVLGNLFSLLPIECGWSVV